MATAGYDPLMAYEAFDKMGQSYDDNVVIRFKIWKKRITCTRK